MRKTIILMMFATLFISGANAQNTNTKRSVLFTLDANEEVADREYFTLQQMAQNHFACIITDTVKKTQTFVFNGKRIAVSYGGLFDFHYLNVLEENGYIVEYRLQDMCYINIKGKIYGPFDKGIYNKTLSSLVFAKDSNGNTDYNRFYYSKTEGKKQNYYLYYNGVKEGTFNGIRFPRKNSVYADCEYLYLLADKWYAHYSDGSNKITPLISGFHYKTNAKGYINTNISGKNSRKYNGGIIKDLRLAENGMYAYLYKENGKWHVNINDKESRGYDEVWYLLLTESGDYAYAYKENEKWYVNMNINGTDKISRGYDKVLCLRFTESGNYAYWYKENEKCHVNVNGKDSREYDEIVYYSLHLSESGDCAYKYKENGKWYVNVNINGTDKSSGGYDEINQIYEITKSGNYAFECRENEKWYINVNGKNSGGHDKVGNVRLTESGKYAYTYKENGKEYVNININGADQSSRGYNMVMRLELTEEGDYSFYYHNDDGKVGINDNGKETEIDYLSDTRSWNYDFTFFKSLLNFYNNFSLKIYSTNREHSLSSSFEDNCVVIDGKRYGNSPALYACYDRNKNAFIWNAIEGKELIVYEHKL